MEKNNLIKRITDSKDTRVKKIILDGKTQEIFNKNEKKIEKLEKIITKDISKNDMDTFMKVLQKMKNNINEYVIEDNN